MDSTRVPIPSARGESSKPTPPDAWWDVVVPVWYLAAAFGVTIDLWRNASGTMLAALGGSDTMLFEWFLAHAAQVVTAADNPFFSTSMNVPDGVNMMANTSVLGLGVPMTPVTLALGPLIAFKLLLTLALAGTAWAWYFTLARHLVRNRTAAFLGGAFAGFAPGMIAHSMGSHLQLTAQFLVPFIVWRGLRLGERGRARRHGLVLGLLVAYQAFIGEEVLLLTACACASAVGVYVVMRPRDAAAIARPFMTGLGIAVAVASMLLAYPLWVQFMGPQSYHGLPFNPDLFYTDLASFTSYARESWFGSVASAQGLAFNPTEEGTFYGWPLVILVPVMATVLWRHRLVARVVGTLLAGFFVLSLGRTIFINGRNSGVYGPWLVLRKIPPFDLALSTRFSLVLIPLIAIALALFWEYLWSEADRAASASTNEVLPAPGRPTAGLRLAASTAVIMALVPITPTALGTIPTPVLPTFLTAGTWRQYLPAGTTLVPVPIPDGAAMDGAHWIASTGLPFATPGGYFIIPTADRTGAQFTSTPRPLSTLLRKVAETAVIPTLNDSDRRAAIDDLRYWKAGLIVLAPGRKNGGALRAALTELFGPPDEVQDVVIWRTASLIGSP